MTSGLPPHWNLYHWYSRFLDERCPLFTAARKAIVSQVHFDSLFKQNRVHSNTWLGIWDDHKSYSLSSKKWCKKEAFKYYKIAKMELCSHMMVSWALPLFEEWMLQTIMFSFTNAVLCENLTLGSQICDMYIIRIWWVLKKRIFSSRR